MSLLIISEAVTVIRFGEMLTIGQKIIGFGKSFKTIFMLFGKISLL